MDNLSDCQCSRIDLSLTLLQLSKPLTTTCFIMLQEGVLVLQVCLRRDSVIADLAPLVCRRLRLDDIQLSTKLRQKLAILLLRELQVLAQLSCQSTSLRAARIDRRQPLSQQRNWLSSLSICQVRLNLAIDELNSYRPKLSLRQDKHVVSTTILHDERDNCLSNILAD